MLAGEKNVSGNKNGYTCEEIERRVKQDFQNDPNVAQPTKGKCSIGYHKIRAEITPDADGFHFKREGPGNGWSEKPNDQEPVRTCKPNKVLNEGDTQCPDICVPDGGK